MQRTILATAFGLFVLAQAGNVARADDFMAYGLVGFSNVQAGTQEGEVVPYFAVGTSPQVGPLIQTGSILNLTGLIPVDATTFIFYGEVGPNPFLPGDSAIHVISTEHGDIFCTWTAVFTLKIINANGDAIFSGDGDFTIVGGTGRYRNVRKLSNVVRDEPR